VTDRLLNPREPAAPPVLPDSLIVLERGWLSSNCILGLDGDSATLIDSGYVSHVGQTLHLVAFMLRHGGQARTLKRLINTHVHSDHMGGNAAIQQHFGCTITIPEGCAPAIAAWDDVALILGPAGQSAPLFRPDGTIKAGDVFEMGQLGWQAIPVPGHDLHMLAFYNEEKRLLISSDALWRNGFGILFPALTAGPDNTHDVFATTRETLARLGRLAVDAVIPGHGAPFAEFGEALREAESRLAAQEARADRLAIHALKALLVFRVLDLRQLERARLPDFLAALPMFGEINRRFLGDLPADTLAERLADELVKHGALRQTNGVLSAR
jgi:glyoxylase-like metal-dependent hydrolase (beta-lactamase superfamily II)